ncbi:hypothetical protein, partial [Pseudomonas sp. SBB6]|uniref:hypothetical protein n=1 Tax=Pseudomonas sp. SBB6 TaxID=2962032 RepID=UPI0020B6A22D
NSAVKRCIADGSVGFPHVRVGHRQDSIPEPLSALQTGVLSFWRLQIALSVLVVVVVLVGAGLPRDEAGTASTPGEA